MLAGKQESPVCAGSVCRLEDDCSRTMSLRLRPQRSLVARRGTNGSISMCARKWRRLAVPLAALTIASCDGDSLPAPPSPPAPRPLVAPATPSLPSATLQAPSPTELRSESVGTVVCGATIKMRLPRQSR